MKYLLGFLLVASIVFVFAQKSFSEKNTSQNGFALLELFTSQGCSSCPSADALLGKYVQQNNPHLICLSFNVDYWNRLGWKDIFSDHRFSQRQTVYANALHSDVYTPQLVVNGSYQFIGSDEKSIDPAINKANNAAPSAAIQAQQSMQQNNIVSVSYNFSGKYEDCRLLAALVQNKTITKIENGENSGATLTEYNVVRDFETVDTPNANGNVQLKIPANVSAKDCSVVLFLQQKQQGAIAGATILPL